jgi:hypothetical protein
VNPQTKEELKKDFYTHWVLIQDWCEEEKYRHASHLMWDWISEKIEEKQKEIDHVKDCLDRVCKHERGHTFDSYPAYWVCDKCGYSEKI